MVNGLHLYSAFIQSALQFLPLIHPFTHTFTHQRRLAAMQGTNQLVRSNWGLGVLLRDTSTSPGWDRTGNPPTARRQLYLLSHIAPITWYLWCISICPVHDSSSTFTVLSTWGKRFSLCCAQFHPCLTPNPEDGEIPTHQPHTPPLPKFKQCCE